jgi:predicted transposase YbfD/YdcC
MSAAIPSASFFSHFAKIEDPRLQRTQLHKLGDILFIAVCATICGANAFTAMEEFGCAKIAWLKKFLELPNGIPSHDTFRNVFIAIKPEAFTECFMSWVKVLKIPIKNKIVAIDGKTSRASGSKTTDKKALHTVSAWATEAKLVLGQVATEEKSNEITAIPLLLKMLELRGAIVTIDAMGCQKEIATEVRERGADYVLQVKGNQEHLEEDIMGAFAAMDEASPQERAEQGLDVFETNDSKHGRKEYRCCEAMPVPKTLRNLAEWKDLTSICRVARIYDEKGASKSEVRYFISSLSAGAKRLAGAVRGHWGVENGLHWVLDMAFDDDRNRTETGDAPENLATLRRWVLSLLRQDKSRKGGIECKRMQMGWNEDYLEAILDLE